MFFCTIVMYLVYLLLITKSSLYCPSFLYQIVHEFHRYHAYLHVKIAHAFDGGASFCLPDINLLTPGVNTRPGN